MIGMNNLSPFYGLDIREVEPGTEIEHNGEKLTVTETEVVRKGRTIYCTAKHVAAIKDHPEVRTTHD